MTGPRGGILSSPQALGAGLIILATVGFGTLGAVIRIRSVIPSRNAVLDIGASGPVAGFLVALPLLFMGVASSQVLPAPSFPAANQDYQSLLSILTALRDGRLTWPPAESKAMILNDSLITWLATVLTHGPLPENAELRLNSIALAAWVGMFVTTLNLTPLGQLDGGHVIYALFGSWAELASRMVSWALLGLGIFASTNWLFWWLLTRLLVGVQHPPSPDLTPLTPRRRAVAILSLVILALTFIPAPISY